MLSIDPEHEGATRSLILNSLGLRDSDHAVDLIEASIRKEEDLDRLLSALSPRFAEGIREDLFYRPITRLFVKRKLWDAALTLLDIWETDLPDTAPEAKARRGWVYLLTGQIEEARRIHDELIAHFKTGEIWSLRVLTNKCGPQEFFEHFGNQFNLPQLIYKTTPSYTKAAIKAKVQGVVLLRGIVRRNGRVDTLSVVQGLGYGLDENAIREIASWKFRPGMRNGQAVDSSVTSFL